MGLLIFGALKLPKDRSVEFQLAKATGPPIVTSLLLKKLKVKHFQLCLVYNLDHIDSDDDGDNDRLALSSVLPNASLCLDCGAYEDCTDTICIQKTLLYFYMY